MRPHRMPPRPMAKLDRLHRFGCGAYPVRLYQNGVHRRAVDRFPDEFAIGDRDYRRP